VMMVEMLMLMMIVLMVMIVLIMMAAAVWPMSPTRSCPTLSLSLSLSLSLCGAAAVADADADAAAGVPHRATLAQLQSCPSHRQTERPSRRQTRACAPGGGSSERVRVRARRPAMGERTYQLV
jgi:hypothetical protein